jgi:hypothetical protein
VSGYALVWRENYMMLNCKQASELLSQQLDRKLSWSERLSLRLHLLVCDGCTNFSKHMTALRAACRNYLEK